VLGLTVLAGCSSAKHPGAGPGSTESGSTQSTAAQPTGAPVVVGLLNQQLGAVAFPDFSAGATAAQAYINQDLRGINGRPLKFVQCFTDGTPEKSIDCANKFVDAHVVAVLQGLDYGSDATLPILSAAGIPLVGHTAFGANQLTSTDAFFFGAGLTAYGATPMWVMSHQLHVKSVVYLGQDNAVVRAFATFGVLPAAKKAGLSGNAVFYSATNPDYTLIAAQALAKHPDAVFFTSSEPDCTGLVAALVGGGFKGPIFAGSCTQFIKADPAAANGVYTANDLWAPSTGSTAPARAAAQLKTFVQQMTVHAPTYVSSGFAQFTFSSTMDLSSILGRISGAISPRTVIAQIKATKGLDSFMGQPLTCDGTAWPGQPSACAAGVIEFKVQHGSLTAFSPGYVDAKSLLAG